MAIRVVCSHCKNSCSLPDSLSGKGMDCPACGHFIAVPTASGGATPPPLTAASLLDLMDQGRGPGWSVPLAPRPRKRTPPTALWAVLGGLLLLLLIVVVAALLKNGCQREAAAEPPNANVRAQG